MMSSITVTVYADTNEGELLLYGGEQIEIYFDQEGIYRATTRGFELSPWTYPLLAEHFSCEISEAEQQ